jgi:hypothetical protein
MEKKNKKKVNYRPVRRAVPALHFADRADTADRLESEERAGAARHGRPGVAKDVADTPDGGVARFPGI